MNFLRPDSEVMEFLGKATDLIILNLLCVLCSIPIVTIGASFTAKYYVSMKIAKGEEPNAVKSFFKSFSLNFKQITPVWIVELLVLLVLAFDWYNLFLGMAKDMPIPMRVVLAVITFLVWSVIYCMFPFMARFQTTTKDLIKASIVMAVLNIPRMVLIFIVTFVPYLVCLWYIQWGLAIWILVTTVSLYYISKEFDIQLEMITKGEDENESRHNEAC